jgi:hypothetical protein
MQQCRRKNKRIAKKCIKRIKPSKNKKTPLFPKIDWKSGVLGFKEFKNNYPRASLLSVFLYWLE